MNNRIIAIRIVFVLLLLSVISVLWGCTPKAPAVIATQVAKEWSADNVKDVSKNIVDLISGDNPLVEMAVAMAIENQINQKIAWEYSEPRKLGEDQYEVIATAYTSIDVPLFGSYKISLNYDLKIDTQHKQVISADTDISSFVFSKQ